MPSVLVVDDAPVDRCLVEGVLKRNSSLQVRSVSDVLSALRAIEAAPPDIVISDLQMPGMNGLDLVTILRERYPGLPVVLTTAHGSEELAIRAIDEGAASYVPKTCLAERLPSTIDHILEASRSARGYLDCRACLREARLRFEVGNDDRILDQLVDLARGTAGGVGLFDSHDQLRLAVAVQGLLCLGFYAGNLELPIQQLDELDVIDSQLHLKAKQRLSEPPFDSRVLRVEFEVSNLHGTFRVSHEGAPWGDALFDAELSGSVMLEAAGTTSESFRPVYRGLVLLRAFADALIMEDGGRTLVMTCLRPTGRRWNNVRSTTP
ncbi:MAG: response regulator [Pirellulales bacterium]